MYLKEGQKLIILLLDGMNFNLGVKNSFFYSPFFYQLFHKNRSLVLERTKNIHPIHSFYSGREILTDQFLVKDIFEQNRFINSQALSKIADSLTRTNGRLWLVADNLRLLKLALREIHKSSIHRVGIISDFSENSLKVNLKKDYQYLSLADVQSKKFNAIDAHDILLFLVDSKDVYKFKNLISNPKLQFNKFIVLTDEAGDEYFESVAANDKKQDFRNILRDHDFSLFESEISTHSDWQMPDKYLVYIYSISANYLDPELPTKLNQERLTKIEDFIFRHFHNPSARVIITAKFGQKYLFNSNSAELIPFIIDEKILPSQFLRTPLEKYLKSRCSVSDVAPTVLDMVEINSPTEFTGNSLLPHLYPENYIGEHSDLGFRIRTNSRKSMFD